MPEIMAIGVTTSAVPERVICAVQSHVPWAFCFRPLPVAGQQHHHAGQRHCQRTLAAISGVFCRHSRLTQFGVLAGRRAPGRHVPE